MKDEDGTIKEFDKHEDGQEIQVVKEKKPKKTKVIEAENTLDMLE